MSEVDKIIQFDQYTPSTIESPYKSNLLDGIIKKDLEKQSTVLAHGDPQMSSELTKSYIENVRLESKANSDILEQKLENIGQRIDLHTQKIVEQNKLLSDKIDSQNKLLSDSMNAQIKLLSGNIESQRERIDQHEATFGNMRQEIKQDGKSTRKTMILTGISVVIGLTGLVYAFITALQASNQAWLMKAIELIQKP
ncbi:hypothetical protein [Maridesulfovibrio ferrireducens]|uniref:hypothetical protein n=1 Tax=Maridesulfovibrio ferrireducens TaxID=246191 RepID=UPI001A1BF343|nr:hypothetical protein [Maridesulfovibrio ferrireducens]MBI9113297.1 hypothetical protein [Maridesulfovibrio ferrireducens]